MSSETDQPRQRTVAELLAEHGDNGAPGRRRRRREPDEPDEAAPGGAPVGEDPARGAGRGAHGGHRADARAAQETSWSVLREPALREPVPSEAGRRGDEPSRGHRAPAPWETPRRDPAPEPPRPRDTPGRRAAPEPAGPAGFAPRPDRTSRVSEPVRPDAALPGRAARHGVPEAPSGRRRAPAAPVERENPTEQIPRYRDAAPEGELTGPIAVPEPAGPGRPDEASTQAVPVPQAGPDDGGPPTRAAALDLDGGPPTQAGAIDFDAFDDVDDHPAGLAPDLAESDADDEPDEQPVPESRRGRSAASEGQAWAAVLAQWIAGALGGALLWVGFRYLWRTFPVVAVAAAAVVTIGLVVIVRALLHNDDRRTTVYAVLVGLLLTVSPAVLVLLGR